MRGRWGAVWWARLRLGPAARLTTDWMEGSPVVSYHGHRVAYRVHRIDGRYFRLVLPCSVCSSEAVVRTYQVRNRRDLAAALDEAAGSGIVCFGCLGTADARIGG